jgi:hypothetical protein
VEASSRDGPKLVRWREEASGLAAHEKQAPSVSHSAQREQREHGPEEAQVLKRRIEWVGWEDRGEQEGGSSGLG